MSERAQHTKKTLWRDTDPEWCGQDDKAITARNRRRAQRKEIHVELVDIDQVNDELQFADALDENDWCEA